MSKYADRDPATLEPHYSEHVNAMTAEKLHEKSAIAAELAYRDKRIAELLRAACYALDSLDAIAVPQEWDCRELLRTAIAKATGAETEKEPSE